MELAFETLLEDAKKLQFTDNDKSYIETYPEFLKFFENLRNLGGIDEHSLIISSHFIYGWMPTVLSFNPEQSKECIEILNRVYDGPMLSEGDLKILIGTINNSIIGVSKLLHFIDNKRYAIWDSNVCEYLNRRFGKEDVWITTKVESYLSYHKILKTLLNEFDMNELREIIIESMKRESPSLILHDNVSDFRMLEMVMFLNGRVFRAEKKMAKRFL